MATRVLDHVRDDNELEALLRSMNTSPKELPIVDHLRIPLIYDEKEVGQGSRNELADYLNIVRIITPSVQKSAARR